MKYYLQCIDFCYSGNIMSSDNLDTLLEFIEDHFDISGNLMMSLMEGRNIGVMVMKEFPIEMTYRDGTREIVAKPSRHHMLAIRLTT